MSAEPRRVSNTDIWTQWEGQIVNGVFPLRRFLDSSDHSAVFLSEYPAKNLPNVAIKFVLAHPQHAEAQLAKWATIAQLSHPNLVRLFDMGRYQAEGREFLFVVMEHADQTLAQVLSRRALNPAEVPEMLLPTLGALTFLHGKRLVHSQLKPSNLLAVDDQLKLASDTVRPGGNFANGMTRTSPYHPPELKDGRISSAGDIWNLGVTLTEALTQSTPSWTGQQGDPVVLPDNLPAPFVDTVRRCLSISTAQRPTASELEAQYKPAPVPVSVPVPPPAPSPAPTIPEAPASVASVTAPVAPTTTAPQSTPKRPLPLLAIATVLLIALAVWGVLHFAGTSQTQPEPPPVPTSAPAPPPAVTKSAEPEPAPATAASVPIEKPAPPPTSSATILLEVSPDVPQSILNKIKGRVLVSVRVLVDPSGNVMGALVENSGPSKYFARVSTNAAREWKFVPVDQQGARVWILTFTYRRDGITTKAAAV